jgi:cation:H+ antiporter
VFLTLLALAAGVGLLAYAADQLVIGAARVALIRNIPALVVGVVIVGFGTSCPELLVSVVAAVGGETDVAVGNIVGSNIANLSLLLGIGAIIVPIAIDSATVRREVPLTVAAMAMFAVAVQGGLNRWEGAALVATMAVVLWWVLTRSANGTDALASEAVEFADATDHSMSTEVTRTVLGLLGTIAGAQLLLYGALDLAERTGLSGGFVGATLVAMGTSLPELVTVIQSARRRETDLIVGNLLGSNLFNTLAVAGLSGLFGPGPVENRSLTVVAVGAALAVSVLAGVAMATRNRVDRWEGFLLVAAYVGIVPLLAG